MPRVLTQEEAEKALRAAGYEPLVPYPGSVRAAWPSRCTTCGAERRPLLNDVSKGKRCKHQKTPDQRAEQREAGIQDLLRENNLIPVADHPLNSATIRHVVCPNCNDNHPVTLARLADNIYACPSAKYEARVQAFTTELRDAGYEPLTPWHNSLHKAWPARCLTCKTVQQPSIARIRKGERCTHENPPEQGFLICTLTGITGNTIRTSIHRPGCHVAPADGQIRHDNQRWTVREHTREQAALHLEQTHSAGRGINLHCRACNGWSPTLT